MNFTLDILLSPNKYSAECICLRCVHCAPFDNCRCLRWDNPEEQVCTLCTKIPALDRNVTTECTYFKFRDGGDIV